jgi:fatty-acyl-CoA synthase
MPDRPLDRWISGNDAAMKVPLTLLDHLRRAEVVYPDRVAIIDEPVQPAESLGSITYRQFAERARALACGLDQLGLDKGDRVAIVSHNSARLLNALFGVSAYGRVVVPINFRLNAEEISYIVRHSGAQVLLIDPELADDLAGVEAPHRFVMGSASDEVLYKFGSTPRFVADDEDATASINYTSGTTARPKGVQLTHRNLWLNAAVFGWQSGVNDRDVYLHTLPLFHVNGWGQSYAVTSMGGTHILLRKVDGPEILRRIDQHGVTFLCGAPAVVNAVLEAAQQWPGPIPGRDRVRMVVAGAPPPTRTIERMETDLGWEFIQLYGLTETSPMLTMNRRRREWDHLSAAQRAVELGRAGAPGLGVELRIDGDGEICARSNLVLEGYWEQPDATAAAIVDGWFHTGDGGTFDDGYLTISDRKKDVIISGGENISSIEIEDALFCHPAVAEVACIAIPDEKWGETPLALVVLAEGMSATPADLIAHCRERLAPFKCPRTIEIRTELARTATGKLQKFKLRQPYWEGRSASVS